MDFANFASNCKHDPLGKQLNCQSTTQVKGYLSIILLLYDEKRVRFTAGNAVPVTRRAWHQSGAEWLKVGGEILLWFIESGVAAHAELGVDGRAGLDWARLRGWLKCWG